MSDNLIKFAKNTNVEEHPELLDSSSVDNLELHWYHISYVYSYGENNIGIGSYTNFRTNPLTKIDKLEMDERLEVAKQFITKDASVQPKAVTILGITYLGFGFKDEFC